MFIDLFNKRQDKIFSEHLELYRNKFHMAHENGRMTNILDLVIYAELFGELFNYLSLTGKSGIGG